MGVEIVELVMAVEEEFDVDLPNSALEHVETAGELFALVRLHLARRDPQAPDAPEEIWRRLVEVVVHETGVDRGRIVPDAAFVGDLRLD